MILNPQKNRIFFIFTEEFFKSEVNSTYIAVFAVNRDGEIVNWKSSTNPQLVPNGSFTNEIKEQINTGRDITISSLLTQLKGSPKSLK